MPRSKAWVDTATLAEQIGCSVDFIYKQRGKLFKPKKHYRILNPTAAKPRYRWHLPSIEKLMEPNDVT